MQSGRTVSESLFELGPHPCDPQASGTAMAINDQCGDEISAGQDSRRKQVEGQEIHVYAEPDGSGFVCFYYAFELTDLPSQIIYVLEIFLGGTAG